MRDVAEDLGVATLLEKFDDAGGVIDYVFLEADDADADSLHRQAALRGISVIDSRLAEWANQHASSELPIERFFRLRWDESKLKGEVVDLSTFWGSDVTEWTFTEERATSIPPVDGYKSAFFLPPYNLRGLKGEHLELFGAINRHVLGGVPERAQIRTWSTDWSNYFDAGHEWWGAYFWTVRPVAMPYSVAIGASSTD